MSPAGLRMLLLTMCVSQSVSKKHSLSHTLKMTHRVNLPGSSHFIDFSFSQQLLCHTDLSDWSPVTVILSKRNFKFNLSCHTHNHVQTIISNTDFTPVVQVTNDCGSKL